MGLWARKALSNLSMNRLAHEGAILVPMAVPLDLLVHAVVETEDIAFEYTMSNT